MAGKSELLTAQDVINSILVPNKSFATRELKDYGTNQAITAERAYQAVNGTTMTVIMKTRFRLKKMFESGCNTWDEYAAAYPTEAAECICKKDLIIYSGDALGQSLKASFTFKIVSNGSTINSKTTDMSVDKNVTFRALSVPPNNVAALPVILYIRGNSTVIGFSQVQISIPQECCILQYSHIYVQRNLEASKNLQEPFGVKIIPYGYSGTFVCSADMYDVDIDCIDRVGSIGKIVCQHPDDAAVQFIFENITIAPAS